MLQFFRALFFKKALQQALDNNQRRRKAITPDKARSIGILFDAGMENLRREVEQYAQKMRGKDKKVALLAYFDSPKPPENPGFDSFFRKEMNWKGVPTNEKALAFCKENFDLLICINPNAHLPLDWLAAHSAAAMKTGLATEKPNDYDFALELPQPISPKLFFEQLHHYLDKIS
ncbi:MAG: hypothetical protein J0L99_06995 [Chitinophagales bacterium]|nr:hypothetical protein [Chitinophagales bacterium]